jgi:hypothetical protein
MGRNAPQHRPDERAMPSFAMRQPKADGGSAGAAAPKKRLGRAPRAEGRAWRTLALTGQLPSSGRALDPETRAVMESRLGADFDPVRVHTGPAAEHAAESLQANAFTIGTDIVFGAGRYAPRSDPGQRLLAHELAHVVQQRRGGPAARRIARQTWGTAATTAPPARNRSPGDVWREQLTHEVALYANAAIVVDWIVALRSPAGGATVTSFKTTDLFADAATTKKLKPVPKASADLAPVLKMLADLGVIAAKAPDEWAIALAPLQPGQTQADVDRAAFDQRRGEVTKFRKSFEARFDAQGHALRPVAMQDLLEDSLAAGARGEFAAQKTAEDRVTATTAELGEFVALRKKGAPVFRVTTDNPARVSVGAATKVMLPVFWRKAPLAIDETDFDRIEPVRTGTSAAAAARRAEIEKRLAAANTALFQAQSFHRFALEMLWFLHRLDATSSVKFHAGTYPRHGKFAEYAADMYPTIAVGADGFYAIGKAEDFVDAINAVAEAGHPVWGKFAWQIIYNDTALQAKINAKYGAFRMGSAPHHGPAPDKLHMHLDIRPLAPEPDVVTGFGVDASGRVVVR